MLHAIHLTKHYQTDHSQLTVLENLSFEIRAGELVCLVGPSGAGKTTLLRLLAGLLLPDKGEVQLHGQPLTGPSAEIGLVFQKANLMPWRTVFDNVALPLQVQHESSGVIQTRVTHALELVNLTEFSESYPHQLSGGMEQRVAIARALAQDPQILLLDEPFGALDALSRERLNNELLRIWQSSGKTILMVTHDIHEAVFLAQRVLVLGHRPAHVVATIPITLPYLRQRYDQQFTALAYQVRQAIG